MNGADGGDISAALTILLQPKVFEIILRVMSDSSLACRQFGEKRPTQAVNQGPSELTSGS